MLTDEFERSLTELTERARDERVALMCAEAVPWRCHRSMIADAMILRGWEVRDILTSAPPAEHHLTPFLQVVNGVPTYPAPDESGVLFPESKDRE